jgi:O-antigen chain-terminating methyltransferase
VATESDAKAEELAAIIQEIRDRVRARYPQGEVRGLEVVLPDLLPILHARDAAEAKVASIGSVNPRPPGLLNNLIQWTKRSVSRSLNWFVRDQVEFNRAVLVAVEATLEALNEVNRTFAAVGARIAEAQTSDLEDIRAHWAQWRQEWERKLLQNEVHYLRGISEVQAAYDHRLSSADASYRELVRAQHAEFTQSIAAAVDDVHKRFWSDLEKVRLEYEQIRLEYERLIHNELRVVRQKAFSSAAPMAAPASSAAESPRTLEFDYTRFADRFRGTEEYVRERQRFYLPFFTERTAVLDVGCGRGEFLELMRETGVPASGVDLDEESVALCRTKGLSAEVADAFDYMSAAPDHSFDGIFAAQVIEHMPPDRVPQLIKLCAAKLKPGGILALETPNPECLAIFATHFYLDPTHSRPIPPALATFYLEEYGFGRVEVHRLSPAIESMPSVAELPPSFRDAFFGGLDYAVIGRKL